MLDDASHQLLVRLGLAEGGGLQSALRERSGDSAGRVVVVLEWGEHRLELEIHEDDSAAPAWKRAQGVRLAYRMPLDGGSPLDHARWGPLLAAVATKLDARDPPDRPTLPELLARVRHQLRASGPDGAQSLPAAARPFVALFHETESSPVDHAIFAAAWELGLLDLLATGPGARADAVATALGASPTYCDALLRALDALELVHEDEAWGFRLTPAGLALQGAWRPAVCAVLEQRRRWHSLSAIVRAGGTTTVTAKEWQELIHAFSANAPGPREALGPRLRAAGLGTVTRLLDVGSGSGAYAEALLQTFPALQVTLVDYPQALAVAEGRLHDAALRARARFVAAPFYDEAWEPPGGHDGVWFANTLHVESTDANASLLRRLHEALPSAGRIWIEERLRVPHDISSSRNELTWMLHTARGRAYSEPEIVALLERTGFAEIRNLARDAGEALFVATRR